MPFVWGDPDDGGDAFLLLGRAIGSVVDGVDGHRHGEPRGLLEVPFVRGRVRALEPGFRGTEEVVGLY